MTNVCVTGTEIWNFACYSVTHLSEEIIVNPAADPNDGILPSRKLLDLTHDLCAPWPATVLHMYINTHTSHIYICAYAVFTSSCAANLGPHQYVILHHVFRMKGSHVSLSGLQLCDITEHAAVHRDLQGHLNVSGVIWKVPRERREAVLTFIEKTSVTVMKTLSSAATEGRCSCSSRLLTE